tara:strand:+ start:766 stop:1845 length:1080 start_codon:yes stop_codon:yes gene_type:complete
MARFVELNPESDIVHNTTKVTTGFFSDGKGTLAGSNLSTASLASSQKNYYYNIQYNSVDHLSVAAGHIQGSGSDSVTNVKGETEAVYKQYATLLLDNNDVDRGFVMVDSTNGTNAVTQSAVYIVAAERLRMKDRVNRKNWTFTLSGSNFAGQPKKLELTDDSNTVAAVASPMGPRYNIVSGSAGTVQTAYTTRTYGHFYPNVGVFLLSANALSASLMVNGHPETKNVDPKAMQSGANLTATGSGLTFDETVATTADNAYKLFVSLYKGSITLRGEEDQITSDYFCRARAVDFNFSMNPTFASGSNNKVRHASMIGNPNTFITEVGLYNNARDLLAVGKLSAPVQKNYGTEATIKVKLTY